MDDKPCVWVDKTQKLPALGNRVLVCLELPQGGKPGVYEVTIYHSGAMGNGFYALLPTFWQVNTNREPRYIPPSEVLYWMPIPNPV